MSERGLDHLQRLLSHAELVSRTLAVCRPAELEDVVREALDRFSRGSADNETGLARLALEELRRRAESL